MKYNILFSNQKERQRETAIVINKTLGVNLIISVFLLIFSFSLVSSTSFGYNILDNEITGDNYYNVTNITQYINQSVNATTDGTQFTSSYPITIDESWLSSFVDDLDYMLKTGDTATGNYTFDSGTFFIDSTNNRVGFNTATPDAPMQIITDGIAQGIDVADSSGGERKRLNIGVYEEGGYIDVFKFGTDQGARNLVIQPNYGRVGISKVPEAYARLSLELSNHNSLVTMDGTYGGLLIGYDGPQIQSRATDHANTGTLKLQPYGGAISLAPNAINPTGYVGIGTATPLTKLHLESAGINFVGNYYLNALFARDATDYAGIGLGYISGEETGLIMVGNSGLTTNNIAFGTYNSGAFTEKMRILGNGNVGIGTTAPNYKLTVGNGSATNYSLVSAYFEGNISSAGYITRTSVYDKTLGSALDLIQDADYYETDGEIDHSKFYGYVSWNNTEIDYSKPISEIYLESECITKDIEVADSISKEQICSDVEKERVVYLETKEVKNEGVLLDKEIDVLRQAVYELKLENIALNKRLDEAGIK